MEVVVIHANLSLLGQLVLILRLASMFEHSKQVDRGWEPPSIQM